MSFVAVRSADRGGRRRVRSGGDARPRSGLRQAPQRPPAADARARRPRRPRGARAQPRAAPLRRQALLAGRRASSAATARSRPRSGARSPRGRRGRSSGSRTSRPRTGAAHSSGCTSGSPTTGTGATTTPSPPGAPPRATSRTRPTRFAPATSSTRGTRRGCRPSCRRSSRRSRIRALPGPQQLAALRAGAAHGGAHAKLLYGTVLQRLGRPVSAEREFTAAVRLAPNDPDARVAEAVGRFDKARPARAFGRLGPLTRVFPRAQTVRFHLGLLLLWSAQVKEARKQLQQAQREDAELAARQAGDAVPGGPRPNWDRLTEIRAVRPMALCPVAVEDCRIPQCRVRNVTRPRGEPRVSEQGVRVKHDLAKWRQGWGMGRVVGAACARAARAVSRAENRILRSTMCAARDP